MAKPRTVSGASTIAIAVLVLVFGSQPFFEWIDKHHSDTSNLINFLLKQLTWPEWLLSPDGNGAAATRAMLASDLRALLLIGATAGIIAATAKGVTKGGTAFMLGWASVIFGSAAAAFLAYFILDGATITSSGSLAQAAAGSTYGLYVGWIVGIVAATTAGKKSS